MDNSEEGHDADQKFAEVESSGQEKILRKRGVLAAGLLLIAWVALGIGLWPVLRDPQRLATAYSALENMIPGWGEGGERSVPGDSPDQETAGAVGVEGFSAHNADADHLLFSPAPPDDGKMTPPDDGKMTSAEVVSRVGNPAAPMVAGPSSTLAEAAAALATSSLLLPLSPAESVAEAATVLSPTTGTATPARPVTSPVGAAPSATTTPETPPPPAPATVTSLLLTAPVTPPTPSSVPERKGRGSTSDDNKTILYEEHFSDDTEEVAQDAPEASQSPVHASASVGNARHGWARVAVIIDDLGYNGPVSEAMARLSADLTLAILPGGGHSRAVANLGRTTGKEVILHQPMEPRGYPRLNPGPGALLMGMERERMRRILVANLEKFPEAKGINNHMGSQFTADTGGMGSVMEVLAERGLFFVDSRTSGRSVGMREAAAHRVPRVQRDVFLDNVPQVKAISQQLARLESVAHRQGSAVAIGHPYPATLAALRAWLPEVKNHKIEIIRASQLVGPESARARYPTHSPVVAQVR
ncbi:MAG: divergent polysaccharide deacetylase family protein [Magnetococcales bacterium]|nr:divergent polysaccharide deacetylase family protein [Magnetococcales bacterium]